MPTILITGGTGSIGRSLSEKLLRKGYEVMVLSREKASLANGESSAKIITARWDIEKQSIDEHAIRNADCIIHLAGANIAKKRWTEKRKKEILESRTKSSALIVKALNEIPNHVKTVVCASAIGWYGQDLTIPPARYFLETDSSDNDFLGETCRLWEESIESVKGLNKRLVKIRTGIVLNHGRGALKEFSRSLRFNIAAILGSGEQMISWIHIDDLCSIYMEAVEHENVSGVYNGVAPIPVNNKELTLAIARKLKGKKYIPVHVPEFILKMALGEMSTEVLKSCTVSCDKIKNTGFQFLYPGIESALKDLLG
ncbi:MAG TPA: TIGR01777 family oxidoreductase [Puia sp.]|nr:TIGR01777 family oxidoreductase [Puia sp.]